MVLTVCTMSSRISATTHPIAEVTPGYRGTIEALRPISYIRAPVCSAPPPNGLAARTCHLGVCDADDRLGRLHCFKTKRYADFPVNGRSCRFDIQPGQFAADRTVQIDPSQHQIGVGDRGPVIAEAIGDRTGVGTGALRPNLQQAAAIDMATEPPPAPMVDISIIGVRITMPKSI